MALKRKIAYIDLTHGQIKIEAIPAAWRTKYLSGRGIGTYLLYKNMVPGSNALKAGNVLVVSAGLLGATLTAPFACTSLLYKSPLTGLLSCAVVNSLFAAELRWAGFDHLVITGKASKPVYLYINNGKIEIKSGFWNLGNYKSRELITKEFPGAKILSIGIAGENLVRFANVMADRGRMTGKTGLGAVFGSKRLKALAVCGSLSLEVKKPQAVLEKQQEYALALKKNYKKQVQPKNGSLK